jgi:glucose-6-phosphate 1-dehydrogenase
VSTIAGHYDESQIYRVDHYLAKGMAKNISVFISSNAIFRNIWNHKFIEKIEIVASEKIGIEGRASFYEETGALRDFIQSHLLQLTALLLMEPCPDPLDFSDLPQRRLAALTAIGAMTQKECARSVRRAQYEGYRQEAGSPSSNTETFAAITLTSDAQRWQKVPITLVTGKKLDKRLSAIKVHFKRTSKSEANLLTLRIQPNGGIDLELWTRKPGFDYRLDKMNLSFVFQQFYRHLPEPYEQVLIDVFRDNRVQFPTSQEILAAWRILEPIQKYWRNQEKKIQTYKPGSSLEDVLNLTYNNHK